MRSATKKSYINISELITNYNKENKNANTHSHPTRHNSFTETHPKLISPHHNPCPLPDPCNQTLKPARDSKESLTAATYTSKRKHPRCREPFNEVFLKKDALQHFEAMNVERAGGVRRGNGGLGMMEELISSERMFIDPERWQGFLGRAREDEGFQKAMSAFLYSYFIQHYQ